MGRPELPVSQPSRPPGILATGLRSVRRAAGISYAELAATARFSRQTLQRAASGNTVPEAAVVVAYAQGCGADPAPLLVLWKRARIDKEQRSRRGLKTSTAPHVRHIRDEADLGAALGRLHLQAGAPSCREVAKRTAKGEGMVRIPKTIAHLIISRQKIPTTREQMQSLLFAYNVAPHRHEAWLEAWSRAARHIEAERARDARHKEARRGPARARRDKLERILATATAGLGPDTDAYLQDVHWARQHRHRTTIQHAGPAEVRFPIPPAASAPAGGNDGPPPVSASPATPQPSPRPAAAYWQTADTRLQIPPIHHTASPQPAPGSWTRADTEPGTGAQGLTPASAQTPPSA
ncbi:helix-turn-helix domain-containing protein [Streptomyces sp. CJ_13]|uniref:helix-turn-helix domain-containing protein n=1 Tax=Streptomyces sp. CJ_13 TaxID=2724943 RepID=UPI001BDCAB18|nr:helix-turn-helix transcriptional regulator [Streptomyces sp. CJ_13]MBT1185194.1 helix-turn-helix domain-containing protein [Streptomyces sp. CJ_13]